MKCFIVLPARDQHQQTNNHKTIFYGYQKLLNNNIYKIPVVLLYDDLFDTLD